MKFKVGQKVILIDDKFMGASLGTIAVVYRVDENYVYVHWGHDANGQGDGGYYPKQFKPLSEKGKQLEFSFME